MRYYLWPVLWMGIIFLFSTDAGSSTHTFYYADAVLRFFFPSITSQEIALAHRIIRKLGHVVEYGILSFFWYIALNQGIRRWSFGTAALALVLSLLYASADEMHQGFVRSRTGSLVDVGIDALGAMGAQMVLFFSLRRSHLPEMAGPQP